jgi:hypothetical protein
MSGRFSRTTWIAVAVALCVLALPAVALASFPKFKKTLIVPNKSVGSLKLKVSYGTAIKELGTNKGGECTKSGGCHWGTVSTGGFSFFMVASKAGATPTVTAITIGAPENPSTGAARFTGPLMKLKTSKKIGLGSTAKAIKHAYPGIKVYSTSKTSGEYVIYGKGSVSKRPSTTFTVTNGRVVDIGVESRQLEG